MASTGDPENVFVLEQDDLAAEESFHYLKNILAASYDLTNAESAFYRANAEVILPSAAIIRSIAPFASDSFNYAGLPRHGALSLPFFIPPPQKLPVVPHHRVPYSFKKTFPAAAHLKGAFNDKLFLQ